MSNLLLLEDDISLIDGLHYSLKKNGFYVDIARTVEEAEKQLAQIEKYDLLYLMFYDPKAKRILYLWIGLIVISENTTLFILIMTILIQIIKQKTKILKQKKF